MNEIKQDIRMALVGSNAQQPVDTKSLLKLGKPDAVAIALDELKASREINTALVIKGGTQTVMCWLTGAIGLTPAFTIRPPHIAPPVRQPDTKTNVAKVKPKTSISPQQTKEKEMPKGKPPGELNTAIHELVIANPGIQMERLVENVMQKLPDTTEFLAKKIISQMAYVGTRICAKGEKGNKTYHSCGEKAAKLEKSKAAKPVRAGLKPAPSPIGEGITHNQNDGFEITLTESSGLRICFGDDVSFFLNMVEAERLYRFIGRIHPVLDLPA